MVPGGLSRLRPKDAVEHVASASNSGTTGGTYSVTIPATATTGDRIFVGITAQSTAAITPPSGVALVPGGTNISSSTSSALLVYTKVLGAGEGGTVLNFASTVNNQSWIVTIGVYRKVGGYSVLPLTYVSTATEAANNRPPRFPSVVPGPKDYVVGLVGNYAYVSTAATAAAVATAPTGWTTRQTVSKANNALTIPRGGSLMDAPGTTGLMSNLFTFNAQSHMACTILVLSPVAPRWTESQYIPPSIAGKPVVVYSTSSNALVAVPEGNWGYNSRTPWGDQITSALGRHADSKNFAMTGSRVEDICTAMYGTKTYNTISTTGDPNTIVRAVTFNTLTNTNALFLTDLIGNNIISSVDSVQVVTGITHAVRSIFRRIRCGNGGVILASTHASVTYSAGWSTAASTGVTSGSYRYTSTPNATASITVSNSTGGLHPFDVVLVGMDNNALGGTGSTFEVYLDGVLYTSGTTHNQMVDTNWGGGGNYRFVQMCVPVMVPSGSHTLMVKHTGASGNLLILDSIQTPSANPPWIVSNTLGRMPDAAYTTYAQLSLLKQAAYSDILESICNEFTDGRVIFYDPSESGFVTGQLDFFASDYVHQREQLMTWYAHEIIQKMWTRIP